ncbi:hypothetical protein K435DRAFT_802083 [Dendrothele bispora CBS 962.96]|uniref:Uncharacterized protein n=1 Tax=Dendrothele bispora (strain CBS 962.96) TaxID=1314807 RepID=A0A4S8LMB3_DENBC|nr:hypothetical protein K435DRAFT_802083 [Dendrothele bispora CBS 962.96]
MYTCVCTSAFTISPIFTVTQFVPVTVTWSRESGDPANWILGKEKSELGVNYVSVSNPKALAGKIPLSFTHLGSFHIIAKPRQTANERSPTRSQGPGTVPKILTPPADILMQKINLNLSHLMYPSDTWSQSGNGSFRLQGNAQITNDSEQHMAMQQPPLIQSTITLPQNTTNTKTSNNSKPSISQQIPMYEQDKPVASEPVLSNDGKVMNTYGTANSAQNSDSMRLSLDDSNTDVIQIQLHCQVHSSSSFPTTSVTSVPTTTSQLNAPVILPSEIANIHMIKDDTNTGVKLLNDVDMPSLMERFKYLCGKKNQNMDSGATFCLKNIKLEKDDIQDVRAGQLTSWIIDAYFEVDDHTSKRYFNFNMKNRQKIDRQMIDDYGIWENHSLKVLMIPIFFEHHWIVAIVDFEFTKIRVYDTSPDDHIHTSTPWKKSPYSKIFKVIGSWINYGSKHIHNHYPAFEEWISVAVHRSTSHANHQNGNPIRESTKKSQRLHKGSGSQNNKKKLDVGIQSYKL